MHLFHHHHHQQERQQPQQYPGQNKPPVPQQPLLRSHEPQYGERAGPPLASDIFAPTPDYPPPIARKPDHPVSRKGVCIRNTSIADPYQVPLILKPPSKPLQTNKFYANLFLGDQANTIWTHPYSLQWCRGGGNARSWGMGIAHIEREQLALGPLNEWGASQYFINPIGIHSMILSAKELGESTQLTTDSLEAFSCNASFSPAPGAAHILTLPLLQGMGFVTGVYCGATPLVQSSVFIRELGPMRLVGDGATASYKITLEDGRTWLAYVTPSERNPQSGRLLKSSNTCIEGFPEFRGTIQIAKLPNCADTSAYDSCAGAYPIACAISGRTDGSRGQYTFSWVKGGLQRPLMMYALPHHVGSFDPSTAQCVTPLRLQTTTKGLATGIVSDQWVMNEQLPVDIDFAPWSRERGSITTLSPEAVQAVTKAAESEIEQDYFTQCCLDSMYFSGKGLAKFAMMIYTVRDLCKNWALAARGLEKLKQAFAVFVENRQRNPLVYDETWKGVVSTAGLNGDAGADFGNTWYNDHHFHYGYFVYAAAVIGYLDPSWIQRSENAAWVNMLVRDFANPTHDSQYFPFSRSFDWFHGHSWAKGLFDSADGKDQESTSEDAFASYAVKMWGRVTGDKNMENRGNLMLSIQARSIPMYFLMERNNSVQPSQFIGNKVTGILFENKSDHATYFGMNPEYIQGIHMIPISPCSSLIRSPNFVREEWDTYFSNGRVDNVGGGWRGIIYANLALIDPKAAYRFFAQPNFDMGWLDGGASRTWYLAFCAALGGA